MIRLIQHRDTLIRLACCVLGIMIVSKFTDPNDIRDMNSDRYEQSNKNMEESQEEDFHKITLLSRSIKIKNLITSPFKHARKIFEYRYQNPFVYILLPPPKRAVNIAKLIIFFSRSI